MLTGEDPSLHKVRRVWRHLPAAPRCKVCASPAHGFGGAWPASSGMGPCATTRCCARPASGSCPSTRAAPSWRSASSSPTSAARRPRRADLGARRSASLIQDYYRSAAIAIDENGGIVDKFLGDGVMALFIPVIAGENHAARAIAAGRAILARSSATAWPRRA